MSYTGFVIPPADMTADIEGDIDSEGHANGGNEGLRRIPESPWTPTRLDHMPTHEEFLVSACMTVASGVDLRKTTSGGIRNAKHDTT